MSENTNQAGDSTQAEASEVTAAADPVVRLTHANSDQVLEVTGNPERYLTNGWRIATLEAPKGNASLEEWQVFARSQGFTEDELAGKARDDLRAALS